MKDKAPAAAERSGGLLVVGAVQMEGLQRSSSTFRRSGSSGLVWDERFLTEEAEAQAAEAGTGTDEAQPDLRRSRSAGGVGILSRRAGGGDDKKKQREKEKEKKKQGQKKEEERDPQVFKTKDVAPDVDPPSPRVSGCILCSIFSGSGSGSAAARRGGRAKAKKKQR
uniref:Uncharacterized protein n=1 Tax=Avena sativa TaxID=4498 RepID=A0ACD6AE85_AVESA